jgi:hypothetical protein
MVTPAKIMGSGTNPHTYKVQVIAYYEYLNNGGKEDFSHTIDARVAMSPGVTPAYKNGDMVYVCIEDNRLDVPVIMGALECDALKSVSDASLSSLTVSGNTKLSSDTSIGVVTKENIACLENVKSNIQSQFDTNIQTQITLLENMKKMLDEQFV